MNVENTNGPKIKGVRCSVSATFKRWVNERKFREEASETSKSSPKCVAQNILKMNWVLCRRQNGVNRLCLALKLGFINFTAIIYIHANTHARANCLPRGNDEIQIRTHLVKPKYTLTALDVQKKTYTHASKRMYQCVIGYSYVAFLSKKFIVLKLFLQNKYKLLKFTKKTKSCYFVAN